MRWADRRPTSAAIILVAAATIAGCGAVEQPASERPSATRAATATAATATAATATAATATQRGGAGLDLPEPGRPFDAAAILEAMAGSRRPGGVPARLQDARIAEAVAAQVWTFDGSAWPQIVAGGSCGAEACTLEIAGTPTGALGEDLYVFSVDPATGSVELVEHDLRGFPPSLLDALADLASELAEGSADGLAPASARWVPPPADGTFVLSLRSGGEEGACGLDLTIDARTARLLEESVVNC